MRRFDKASRWTFAAVTIVLNVARQAAFPPSEVGSAATIGLAFAVVAIAFALTAAFRTMFRSGGD
ncbi:hypothetical protein [Streptomyces sp. NRRL F-5123]|uniref:hypothetical protein n=1 Tax=Streptomyces sp. NRRL F-5123 TaxID=1463856 RepID=UPI0004E20110|nr:hypothetical protein [Streptomyces sp. NRRL F-5123]